MSYIEAEGVLMGANMKKGGKMVLQIEVTGDLNSKEDYFHLRKMIERNVRFTLDSQVVQYNVQIDARTEKPIKTYKVDESGIVHEMKPEGEQVEMDLDGVPKERVPVKEVPEEIDRKIVDEFILEMLAPEFDDLQYPFNVWIRMLEKGLTYSRIASDHGMSSGKVADLIDEYRARVAPLAAKWDEWRQSKGEQPPENQNVPPANDQAESANGSVVSENDEHTASEVQEDNESEGVQDIPEPAAEEEMDDVGTDEDGEEPDPAAEDATADHTDELEDWERDVLRAQPAEPKQTRPIDLDAYILTQKPRFPEIEFDFPTLLARKKAGETWMEIATSLGTRSTVLSAAWSKYKKMVQEHIDKNGAA